MLEMRENVIMTAKGQLHGRGFAAGPHIEQSILSEHGAFLVFSPLFFSLVCDAVLQSHLFARFLYGLRFQLRRIPRAYV